MERGEWWGARGLRRCGEKQGPRARTRTQSQGTPDTVNAASGHGQGPSFSSSSFVRGWRAVTGHFGVGGGLSLGQRMSRIRRHRSRFPRWRRSASEARLLPPVGPANSKNASRGELASTRDRAGHGPNRGRRAVSPGVTTCIPPDRAPPPPPSSPERAPERRVPCGPATNKIYLRKEGEGDGGRRMRRGAVPRGPASLQQSPESAPDPPSARPAPGGRPGLSTNEKPSLTRMTSRPSEVS